jgi:hypothetical protein
MKKKILSLMFCMLMITAIPLAAGTAVDSSDDENDALLGWTILRGFVFNVKKVGNDLHFRAIRLHYTQFTGMEWSTGVVKLKDCSVSDLGPDRMVSLGPLGSFSWLFAVCHGGLNVA